MPIKTKNNSFKIQKSIFYYKNIPIKRTPMELKVKPFNQKGIPFFDFKGSQLPHIAK
jgi:hypothetical protein